MSKIFFLVWCLSLNLRIFTQVSFGLYQFSNSPSSLQTNPAYFMPSQYYFNIVGLSLLPSINVQATSNLISSGQFSYPFLNQKTYQHADIRGFFTGYSDIFYSGFRIKENHYLRYHVGLGGASLFRFDRVLLNEILNTPTGTPFSITDFYFSTFLYAQHLLGYTWKNKKLNLGINLKYLNAYGAIDLSNFNFNILYEKTTGDISIEGTNEALLFLPQKDFFGAIFFYSGNPGFATDLGLQYHISPQLNFSFSASNLGFFSLQSKNIQQYFFSIGTSFNVNPPQTGNTAIENFFNSVSHIYKSISPYLTKEQQSGKYKQMVLLPMQFHVGVNYLLKEQHDFHFSYLSTVSSEKITWYYYYDVGLGYIWRMPIFQPLIQLHINNYSFLNITLGFLMNIKAFQFHLLIDDALMAGGNLRLQFGTAWFFMRDSPAERWQK